jgi:hypothetical protein
LIFDSVKFINVSVPGSTPLQGLTESPPKARSCSGPPPVASHAFPGALAFLRHVDKHAKCKA